MLLPRAAFVLSALLAACQAGEPIPSTGVLSASWTGREAGSAQMEASAILCPRDSTLQILAHVGDRGIGVALYLTGGAPATGTFPLVNPETEFMGRPGATGAFRFLTVEALHAHVSRDGEVELTDVGPTGVSGRVTMNTMSRDGPDSARVVGTFSRVPVDSTVAPCGVAPRTPVEVF
jgi:hypothetical protein